jgi:hypothetical protein
VPIGQGRLIGRPGDLSGGTDFMQEIHHHEHGAGSIVPAEAPHGLDLNADHH